MELNNLVAGQTHNRVWFLFVGRNGKLALIIGNQFFISPLKDGISNGARVTANGFSRAALND